MDQTPEVIPERMTSLDRRLANAARRALDEKAQQGAGLTDPKTTPRFGPAETAKPLPAGLTPAAQYSGTLGDRVNAIEAAFARFRAADVEPPAAWDEERTRIGKFLQFRPETAEALAGWNYQDAMNTKIIDSRELAKRAWLGSPRSDQPVSVPAALAALRGAMERDPGFAATWHANIAMAFKDAWDQDVQGKGLNVGQHARAHVDKIANAAATHFMQQAFGVSVPRPGDAPVDNGQRALDQVRQLLEDEFGVDVERPLPRHHPLLNGNQINWGVDFVAGDDITMIAYRSHPGDAEKFALVDDVRRVINEQSGIGGSAAQWSAEEIAAMQDANARQAITASAPKGLHDNVAHATRLMREMNHNMKIANAPTRLLGGPHCTCSECRRLSVAIRED